MNDANLDFVSKLKEAKAKNDSAGAFYISPDKTFVDFDPGITSFLCTDVSRDIFEDGARSLRPCSSNIPTTVRRGRRRRQPDQRAGCLREARDFYKYAVSKVIADRRTNYSGAAKHYVQGTK